MGISDPLEYDELYPTELPPLSGSKLHSRASRYARKSCLQTQRLSKQLLDWQLSKTPALWFGSLQALAKSDQDFWAAIKHISGSVLR
jgi:hypothetical protein